MNKIQKEIKHDIDKTLEEMKKGLRDLACLRLQCVTQRSMIKRCRNEDTIP